MDKIKEIIQKDSLSGDTRMVLVNAIYFFGTWKTPFNKRVTQNGTFKVEQRNSTGGNLSSVKVDMMQQKDWFLTCKPKGINARVLQMNYTGDKLSMIFILPDKDNFLKQQNTMTYDMYTP